MSRAELVRASGLTKPTVMAIVQVPARRRDRDRIGHAHGRRTRRAPGIAPVVQQRGEDRRGGPDRARTRTDPRDGRRHRARRAARSRRRGTRTPCWSGWWARSGGSPGASLGSVGLAVPGFIDHHAGTVTYAPRGWDRVPMQPRVEDGLGVPVGLLSLPAATVVGETIADQSAQHDDAVLVFLHYGIGAGILSRGHLLVGAGGAVGELGHCPVGSGLPCRCGRHGLPRDRRRRLGHPRPGGPSRPVRAREPRAARGAARSADRRRAGVRRHEPRRRHGLAGQPARPVDRDPGRHDVRTRRRRLLRDLRRSPRAVRGRAPT